MNNTTKNILTVIDILAVVAIVFILIHFFNIMKTNESHADTSIDLVHRTAPIAKMIYDQRTEDEECKELNLELYVHLRSLGYHPDVQVGTKNGSGHLWLELQGMVFDVTAPEYYGRKVAELKGVYKLDKLIEVKK